MRRDRRPGAAEASPDETPGSPQRRGRGVRRALPGPVIALSARTRALLIWSCIGLLLLTAVIAGAGAMQRELYSAQAFASRYLHALERGDAAAALELPGVLPSEQNQPVTALLRGDVLPEYREISAHDAGVDAQGRHRIVTHALIDGEAVSGTLLVEQHGTHLGLFPSWRFAVSPTATVEMRIEHTPGFSLNGRELDVRQLGVDRAFSHAFDALLFVPGRYTLEREDPYVSAPPVSITLGDAGTAGSLTMNASATPEFTELVSTAVHERLDECAEQRALYPSGCPFGYEVEDRIEGEPEWHIRNYPAVKLVPGTEGWALEPTVLEAEITLQLRSIFDGSLRTTTEPVTTGIGGDITLDGDAVTVHLRNE